MALDITSVQPSMNIGHLVDIGVERFPNMILIKNEYALVSPIMLANSYNAVKCMEHVKAEDSKISPELFGRVSNISNIPGNKALPFWIPVVSIIISPGIGSLLFSDVKISCYSDC